jgi:hypothetical protein
MTRLRRPWPAVIVASSIAVAICNWLAVGQPMRTIAAFWFFLVCPGLAVVGMIDIRDRLAEAIVAVALSIAIVTGVAMVMVMAEIWSPDAGLAVLIAISLAGAAAQAVLRRRQERAADDPALRTSA